LTKSSASTQVSCPPSNLADWPEALSMQVTFCQQF